MAEHLERTLRAVRWQITEVYRPNVFELLTRLEITEVFARVEHTNETGKMALLADAIARGALEFGRINYGTRNRAFQVFGSWPMTALAGDGSLLKLGSPRIDLPTRKCDAACQNGKEGILR